MFPPLRYAMIHGSDILAFRQKERALTDAHSRTQSLPIFACFNCKYGKTKQDYQGCPNPLANDIALRVGDVLVLDRSIHLVSLSTWGVGEQAGWFNNQFDADLPFGYVKKTIEHGHLLWVFPSKFVHFSGSCYSTEEYRVLLPIAPLMIPNIMITMKTSPKPWSHLLIRFFKGVEPINNFQTRGTSVDARILDPL